MKNLPKLAISIIIPLAVGFISSFFTRNSIPTWYNTLVKPALSPPNWIFFPVWTLLYVMMGISLYFVWRKGFNNKTKTAIYLFSAQLLLNFLWTFLFFGLKSMLLAFVEIIILWIMILVTILRFYKISKLAAYLLIPYIVWVSFASYLNFSVFLLNPTPFTVGVNCPNNNCVLLGASCGTVTPGYNDECCANKNIDTPHIACTGGWKYLAESNQCVYFCD